ncbi:MAG: 3-hydroxybutyryl-CoA dehydrogenase [Actinophytocola sp.]|uniref:3-hydroxyacyl-CoA dehydrogenase family protein n=1 Tax=Actinophytocola sp. TaxID=1872138 RepID=UPI0013261B25|nr:3-hydroxyacyl-CoA dehydrogenase family protein [Actinophytocola sp.]MPZ83196.1 3-hydroxybutyryl-CoA dehydrogenase [Actinophytocola sp.]
MTDVRDVTVVGAGVMGCGIAQVAAGAGCDVTLVDISPASLTAARDAIATSLNRLVRAARLTRTRADDALRHIRLTTSLDEPAARADLVIEAIVEDLGAKQALFRRLDGLCRADVVLATNTSQFPMTQVAQHTADPSRVIGMHWSNPPQLMLLVELVVGRSTSEEALRVVREFAARCGREYVVCRTDLPGFISNRLSVALFTEAGRMVDDGVAGPADIDRVARMMFGHRMGPLETQDLAGLDTVLRATTAMASFYGERFEPPESLRALVSAGRLGRKTSGGFYDYVDGEKHEPGTEQ